MIFLFPVPLWLLVVGFLGSLAFLIYDMIEDAGLRPGSRLYQSPGALDDMAKRIEQHLNANKIVEAECLLKRLAATQKVQS